MAFYKTKKGKEIAKIIGQKNKINTKKFYKTERGKQVKIETSKSNSILMKEKILKGEFTPKWSQNRRTHWQYKYDNIQFKSSWEVLAYKMLIAKFGKNNVFYEKHRIKYFSDVDKKYHVYIVDFSCRIDNKWTLVEVKPKELLYKNMDKFIYALGYCLVHNMDFIILTGDTICKLQ